MHAIESMISHLILAVIDDAKYVCLQMSQGSWSILHVKRGPKMFSSWSETFHLNLLHATKCTEMPLVRLIVRPCSTVCSQIKRNLEKWSWVSLRKMFQRCNEKNDCRVAALSVYLLSAYMQGGRCVHWAEEDYSIDCMDRYPSKAGRETWSSFWPLKWWITKQRPKIILKIGSRRS